MIRIELEVLKISEFPIHNPAIFHPIRNAWSFLDDFFSKLN